MENMSTRIEQLLLKKNSGNQSEMARFIGVTPQAVQKWIAGDSEPRGKNLEMAAQFLGVSPAMLKFGSDTGLSRVTALHPDDPKPDDVIYVKESRIEFSGGNGKVTIHELVEDTEPATYRLSWFQKHGINPSKVRRFRVSGDSMIPMLFPRDTILVNIEEVNIIDGKLYAIRYGDELRVKYLSRRLDGTLILRSVNPQYKDEEISPEMAIEHISIIGRVRDTSGTGGL